MEIAVLPIGVTSLTNKEIETSIQALAFTLTAHGVWTDPKVALDYIIAGAEINIQKQSGSDTQTLIQSLRIADLAEICTHNEGVIHILSPNPLSPLKTVVKFTIEVCNGGALLLDDNSKLLVAFNNFPADEIQITVDAIDHPQSTDTYIRYEAKFCNANVSKDFNIEAAYAMSLPIDKVKALELTYSNGKNVKLTKRELEMILLMAQDPVYNFNGRTHFGVGFFATLSVEAVITARVTLTENSNFYLLKNQNI